MMATFFKKLFGSDAHLTNERVMYEAIVAQARQPWFYADLQVPDTVSGRFDMIALHGFLVMERLSEGGEAEMAMSQALFDETFRDMDRSLREMGVGDTSVGKRVRKMAEVFYGRAEVYRAALAQATDDELRTAVARNVYAGEAPPDCAGRLARYIRQAQDALSASDLNELMHGTVRFPQPGADA